MSATFRGTQGKKKMLKLMDGSNFIETGDDSTERKLDVRVIGRVKHEEIHSKVVEITLDKIREMPVVIILDTIEECN